MYKKFVVMSIVLLFMFANLSFCKTEQETTNEEELSNLMYKENLSLEEVNKILADDVERLSEEISNLYKKEKKSKKLNDKVIKAEKTNSLIAFGVKTVLCIWGFSQKNTYGVVTGILFGVGAGNNLYEAIYRF